MWKSIVKFLLQAVIEEVIADYQKKQTSGETKNG